jgi:hypothetical protein
VRTQWHALLCGWVDGCLGGCVGGSVRKCSCVHAVATPAVQVSGRGLLLCVYVGGGAQHTCAPTVVPTCGVAVAVRAMQGTPLSTDLSLDSCRYVGLQRANSRTSSTTNRSISDQHQEHRNKQELTDTWRHAVLRCAGRVSSTAQQGYAHTCKQHVTGSPVELL